MRKAKKYIGRIVKIENKLGHTGKKTIDYVGITTDFNRFKENYFLNALSEKYETVTLFKDNVILYKCDIRNAQGNLATLYEIRNKWFKNKFLYRDFYTKEQIKILLQHDYCVAVQGLKEINESDLSELEDSNINVNWKYLNGFGQQWRFYEQHGYEVGTEGFYID